MLLRSELLRDYSVEVTSQSVIETPRGTRETEVRERQYYGGADEFRREVLRMKQDGAIVNPATAGREEAAAVWVVSGSSFRAVIL